MKSYGTMDKTMVLWGKKPMVLYRKLWNVDLLRENYDTMGKILWYFSKLQ